MALRRSPRARMVVKLTLACSLCWAATEPLVGTPPVFATLVPLIAFRKEDAWSTWQGSFARLLGVFVGVGIGLLVLRISRPEVWWVALVVLITAMAQNLPVLGRHFLQNWQIAISALLVLVVGSGSFALERLVETALGGVITLAVAVLVWPPDPVEELDRRLTGCVEHLTAALAWIPGGVDAPAGESRALLGELWKASATASLAAAAGRFAV